MPNLRPLAAALLLSAFCSPFAHAQTTPAGPPVAPVRPVANTYFGTTLTDPYQWMEQLDVPEVKAWFKSQSDYSRAYLDKITGRDTLLARITALDHAGTSVTNVQYGGGMYFYEKTTPEGENGKLYVRQGLTGAERVLFDPETLTKAGVHYSLDTYAPSLDGKYVAYAASPGGSEHGSVYVLETATGNALPDVISRTAFTTLSWLPDGRSFFYVRMPQLRPDAPPSEQDTQARVYVHHLGGAPDAEPAVFGYGLSRQIPTTLADSFAVTYTPASRYAFGIVSHGVQPEVSLYAAPLTSLNGPKTPWRKIADVPDAVTSFDVHGDDAYLLTHKGASRYRVVRVSLSHPDVAHAQVIVPPGEAVIESLGVAQDALYLQDLDGGLGRIRRVGFDGKVQSVPMPFDGSVTLSTDARLPGALIRLGGWTRSSLYYTYDPAQNTLTDSGLKPADPTDFSAITSVEVRARSADGTLVPLSIVYRKDLTLDGTHPTLLEGYGSYGYSLKPYFDATSLAWLEKGGVLAYAHVRGGGEYGEDWHQAGMKLRKPNSWHDLYACAYYLIEHGYTASAHLACKGTSAGGDLINPAYVERPSLFAAAISNVGDTDAVRFELMPGGPSNIVEFGTATDPVGFQGLYAMDAYQHVRDGVAYPAVLLTTGINDPRVSPWEPAKMTARLQAASTSGKPVLLRVDYDAGHGGIDTTKAQRDSEQADEDAFLFQQLGGPPVQSGEVNAISPITVTGSSMADVKRPAGFQAFWRGVKGELADVPLEWERLPGAGGETDAYVVDWLRFSSLGDVLIYGWLAVPKDLPPGSHRGYLWLPGYSLGHPQPGPECLYPDTLTFGLNLHGNLPNEPYDHPSAAGADYVTRGIDSPQTYVYRGIVAHCLRALEVLAAQPDVDSNRLLAGGMSQGGGLALVTSALSPDVKLCLADMPWLCSLELALSLLDRAKYKRLHAARYPDARGLIADYAEAHPERAAQVYETYAYFDPLSHAADVRCPTRMSAGGRDPSCKPPTIYAVYDELTCEKEMLYLPQTGHEIVPAMREAHGNWVQRV